MSETAPTPFSNARIMLTMANANGHITLSFTFETFEQAKDEYNGLYTAITNTDYSNYTIEHIGGRTALFNIRNIIALTISSRTEEDNARLKDIPYLAHLERLEEEMSEKAKGSKVGIHIQ